MTSKTAFAGIPRGNDKQALSALIQNVETFMGSRGSGLDKAVTLRQLVELQLVSTRLNKGKVVQVQNNTVSSISAPPVKPTGFSATGTWSNIILAWDSVGQASYAYTEIWRSETDNFGEAVKIDQTSGSLYSDGVGTDRAYYYWIRHVNNQGKLSAINATDGTYAQTSIDIEDILAELGEQINSSHLAQTLRDRIDLIDAPVTGLVAQIDSLSDDYSDLSLELNTLADSVLSESGRIDQIIDDANNRVAAVDAQISSINADAQATKDNADKALAVLGSAVDDYVNNGVTVPVLTSNLNQVAEQISYSSDQAALASIQIALKQEQISEKLDRYNFDFQTFRDAAFNVDPDNGSIEMVAVDALRTETFSSITTLTQRLDAVDGTISLLGTKARQDALETQINEVGLTIDAVNASLELKADQATVSAQGSTLSQLSIDLDAAESSIELKADLTVTDGLGTALNQLSVDLDAAEAAIELKADSTITDGLTTTVNSALTRLDAAEASIALKASSTAVNAIDTRLSTAELEIDGLESEITLKVSKTAFENVVAAEFDPSVKYNQGDQVIYQSKLWECHTDIPAAGNWQSTAYWTNKGQIATRFAQAEQRLTVTEDNLASLTTEIESLNLDEALTTLATASQTIETFADEQEAQANFNQSIQAEFYNSELASIAALLAQETQLGKLDGITFSISGIEQTQQALANDIEANAQQTLLLQAQFNNSLASIYERQAVTARQNEVLISDTKTLAGQIADSKGTIESILTLDITDESVEGSKLALMYADVGDSKSKIATLETNRTTDNEIELGRYNELSGKIGSNVEGEESGILGDIKVTQGAIKSLEDFSLSPDTVLATKINSIEGRVGANETKYQNIIDLNLSEDSSLMTDLKNLSTTANLGVTNAATANSNIAKTLSLDSDFLAGTQLLSDLTTLKNEVFDAEGNSTIFANINALKSLDTDALAGTVLLNDMSSLKAKLAGTEQSALSSSINSLKTLDVDALNGTQFLQTLEQLQADVKDSDGQTKLSAVITAIKTLDQDALAGTQLLSDINQLKAVLTDPDTGADLSALVSDLLQLEQDGASVTQMLSRISALEGDVYLPESGTKLDAEILKVVTLDQDGLAGTQLLNDMNSLKAEVFNADGESAIYGQIEDINNLNLTPEKALAQTFSNINTKFDASAASSIQGALALEQEIKRKLISEANILESQQTLSQANEAQAQKNLELEAKLTDAETKLQVAYAGVVQAFKAITKEEEARVTENKTLSAALATAKAELAGSISALSEVYATPEGVSAIIENELNATYGLTDENGDLLVVTSTGLTETLGSYATESYAETKKQEAISAASTDASSRVSTLTQTLSGDKDTEGSIAKAISQYTATNPETEESATLEQLFSVAYNKGVAASDSAQEAKDAYTAQWSIKTDVNDLQGGVGFYNDGTTTSFLINANLFSFIGPGNTVTPLFTIRQNVNGYEDGVYMRDVYIDDLAVADVIARTIQADDFKSATSTNVAITGGSININDKFTVDNQGQVDAKAITIRNASGDVILSSGSGIPSSAVSGLGGLATKSSVNYNTDVSGKPDIAGIAQSTIDLTYIKNLLVDQIIAAKVYADNIEGDIREYYSVAPYFTGSCEFIPESRLIGKITLTPKPFDRIFVVTKGFHTDVTGEGTSFGTIYPDPIYNSTVEVSGGTTNLSGISGYDSNQYEHAHFLIHANQTGVIRFVLSGNLTRTYEANTGTIMEPDYRDVTNYRTVKLDHLKMYSEKFGTTSFINSVGD